MHVSETDMRKCIIPDRQTKIFIFYQNVFVSFSKQAQIQDSFYLLQDHRSRYGGITLRSAKCAACQLPGEGPTNEEDVKPNDDDDEITKHVIFYLQ